MKAVSDPVVRVFCALLSASILLVAGTAATGAQGQRGSGEHDRWERAQAIAAYHGFVPYVQ